MPDNVSTNAPAASDAAATAAAAAIAATAAASTAAPAAAATVAPANTAPANTDAAATAAAAAAASQAADPAKVAADAAAKVVADKAIADAQAAASKKIADDATTALSTKLVKTVGDMRAGWERDSKTDAEYGGTNYDANKAVAVSAIEAYGSPALKTFLADTGLGNHPELIRAFYKVGKDIAESKLIVGRQAEGAAGGKSVAQRLYPNNP